MTSFFIRRGVKLVAVASVFLFVTSQLHAQDSLAFASGSWYDPARNGEGFVVQVMDNGTAVVTWFTYPPEGEEGEQAWLQGQGPIEGNRIVINEVVRPTGAIFGPDYDPSQVTREPWGSMELTFTGCDAATVSYSGPEAFGEGSFSLIRLSKIDDVLCQGEAPAEANRVISGRSGAWFQPSHDGEGWMVEVLSDGRVVVYGSLMTIPASRPG